VSEQTRHLNLSSTFPLSAQTLHEGSHGKQILFLVSPLIVKPVLHLVVQVYPVVVDCKNLFLSSYQHERQKLGLEPKHEEQG
jgi:hypothetical protein